MAKSGRPNKSDPRVDNLSYEIRDGNLENVKKLLLEIGIDSLDGYQRTSLLWSSFYNNTELLKWLLENGANINHKDKNGFSALHFAAQEHCFEVVEMLINNKADLEIKDSNGNTPLMKAIFNSKRDYKIVALLIENGANLDNFNNHEMTPRLLAESISGFDYKFPSKNDNPIKNNVNI